MGKEDVVSLGIVAVIWFGFKCGTFQSSIIY